MSKQIRTDSATYARLARRGLSDAEILAELDKEDRKGAEALMRLGVTNDDLLPAHEGPMKIETHPDAPTFKRTEKRAGGRIKRTLVRDPKVGVTFGSKVEARRYDWLIAQPDVVHVDVHPIFSLPKGERYHADFLVWKRRRCTWHCAVDRLPNGTHVDECFECEVHPDAVEDVKGRTPSTDFNRTRALFDSSHPLSPLRVVVWRKGEWREI